MKKNLVRSIFTLAVFVLALSANAVCATDIVVRNGETAVVPLERVDNSSTSQGQTLRLSVDIRPLVVSHDHPYSLVLSAVSEGSEVINIATVSPFPSLNVGIARSLDVLVDRSQLPADISSIQVGLVPIIVGDDLGASAVIVDSARLTSIPN